MKVQICFSKDADLNKVEAQLQQLAENKDFEFISCFLPKRVVFAQGWSTDIVDIIDRTLGARHVYALQNCQSFDDCMDKLNEQRIVVANSVDKLFVLDSGVAEGVRAEIDLFVNQKVILMP